MSFESQLEILAAPIELGFTPDLCDIYDGLTPEMFDTDFNKRVFSAICVLRKNLAVVDPNTISQQTGVESDLIGVVNMTHSTFSCKEFHYHAERVRSAHAMALAKADLAALLEVMKSAKTVDASGVHERLTALAKHFEPQEQRGAESIGQALEGYADTLQARFDGEEWAVGLDIGLDLHINPTDLIVAGGAPGMGKTALLLYVADHLAQKNQKSLIFSLEMSARQLAERQISRLSGVSVLGLKNPRANEFDHAAVSDSIGKASQLPIFIDDTPKLSILGLRAKARRFKEQHPDLKLIGLDYLTLMQMPKADRRDLSVGEVTREAKLLAKELNTPILLLSQLNRASLSQGRKPDIYDLKDSSAIEQDADVIIFPYREKDSETNSDLAQILVRKYRDGEQFDKTMGFEKGNFTHTNRVWQDEPKGELTTVDLKNKYKGWGK